MGFGLLLHNRGSRADLAHGIVPLAATVCAGPPRNRKRMLLISAMCVAPERRPHDGQDHLGSLCSYAAGASFVALAVML